MKINNIIFNILEEQPSFDSKTRPLVDAIKNRHPVTFYYRGPRKPKKDSVKEGGRYKAEMVAMGLNKKGNLIVRTWIQPPSQSKTGFNKHGWRTFRVDRMSNISVFSDKTFDTKRPNYVEGDDKSMTVTYVTSNWDKTPEVKPQPPVPKKVEVPKPEVKPTKQELPKPEPTKKPEKIIPEPTKPEEPVQTTKVEPIKQELPQPKPEEKPKETPDEEGDEETNLTEEFYPLEGDDIETDKAVMYGIYTDHVSDDTYEENNGIVELPEKGFLITGVQLKDDYNKGEGSGQEIYKMALDKYKVLYSTFPISKDAMRVHDKLEEKGFATIEMVDLPNDMYLRKITKIENSDDNQLQESILRFKSLISYKFYL